MVDNFSIALAHLLIAIALWRLYWRDDLDQEPPPEPDPEGSGNGFARKPKPRAPFGKPKGPTSDA